MSVYHVQDMVLVWGYSDDSNRKAPHTHELPAWLWEGHEITVFDVYMIMHGP